MKGKFFIALSLLAALLTGGVPIPAQAGTDPRPEEGSTVTGAFPVKGAEGLSVRQSVTLHIGTFPDAEEYDGYVRSEYELTNHTAQAKTLHMFFPCGTEPLYAHTAGAESCKLTADGNAIEASLRYSYIGYYKRVFNVETCLAQLDREIPPDAFYGEEVSVHEHTFSFDLPQSSMGDKRYLTFMLTFDCDPTATRVLSTRRMYTEIVDGRVQASFDAEAGSNEITLTVVGEDVDSLTEGVYSDRTMEHAAAYEEGAHSENTCTLAEYAMRTRPAHSAISEQDWYCGFVQMLSRSATYNTCLVYATPDLLREEAFMPWYEYDLTVPANGTLVHAVEQPLYPTLEEGYFEYLYLLSPLSAWGPGVLEIEIDTPYFLAYSSLKFEDEGGKYTVTRDRLPLGELSFALAQSQDSYTEIVAPRPETPSPGLMFAYILLTVLAALAVIGTVIAVLLIRKNRHRT